MGTDEEPLYIEKHHAGTGGVFVTSHDAQIKIRHYLTPEKVDELIRFLGKEKDES